MSVVKSADLPLEKKSFTMVVLAHEMMANLRHDLHHIEYFLFTARKSLIRATAGQICGQTNAPGKNRLARR